jgi:hypothetical protein
MEPRELIARLDQHRGSFPEQLVAEAIARQEEIIPVLLQILEDVERDAEPWLVDESRMDHIYALYLLALFRETRAYPLVVRIFSRPGEFPFDLAGGVVTQDLGRILPSISGGDLSGMAALIENEQANEYVRAVAMDGIVSLVTLGQRTREEAMAYFLSLFQRLERTPGSQWDGLANVCGDLWPQEAMEDLWRAYDDGLIDPGSIDWEDLEEALALGKQGAMRRARYREPLITDLAKDMGWMQCFHTTEKIHDLDKSLDMGPLDLLAGDLAIAPIRRTEPKIGRNEPCPCGSGKKFKKCCGRN